ncbi:MAG: hypothetical protein H6741_34440 [Alphaproteobacteria bacterium]|nr:hypothetical protein [Alphaproteobacteria bacterium]
MSVRSYIAPLSPLPPYRALPGPWQVFPGLSWQGEPLLRGLATPDGEDVRGAWVAAWSTVLAAWHGAGPRRGLYACIVTDDPEGALRRMFAAWGPPVVLVSPRDARRLQAELTLRPERQGLTRVFSPQEPSELQQILHLAQSPWVMFGEGAVEELAPHVLQHERDVSEALALLEPWVARVGLRADGALCVESAQRAPVLEVLQGLGPVQSAEEDFASGWRPVSTPESAPDTLHVRGQGPLSSLLQPSIRRVWLEETTWVDVEALASLPAPEALVAQTGLLWSLEGLHALRRLELAGPPLAGWDPAHTPRLEALTLERASAASLQSMAGAPSLRTLCIFNTDDPGAALQAISSFSGLEQVELGFAAPDLSWTSELTELRQLRIALGGAQALDLSPLARCHHLESLALPHAALRSLRPLEGLPLRELVVFADGLALEPLARLPKLERLTLRGGGLPSALAEQLSGVRALALLDVEQVSVAPLQRLPALQALDLSGSTVADPEALAGLPGVRVGPWSAPPTNPGSPSPT